MKIRFAIVRPDILPQVRAEVETLRTAVNAGNMEGVDVATAKLLALTAGRHAVELSEEEWRVFLDGLRSKNPEFQSDYLLPSEVCAGILPTVVANDFVLELPIDGPTEKEGADV